MAVICKELLDTDKENTNAFQEMGKCNGHCMVRNATRRQGNGRVPHTATHRQASWNYNSPLGPPWWTVTGNTCED